MESSQADKIATALTGVMMEYRKAKGLTYEELADHAGIHRTTIALWERGERSSTIQLALQVAAALGVELSELVSRAEAMVAGKAPQSGKAVSRRIVKADHFHNEQILLRLTGLDHSCLRRAIEGTYQTLDTIDFQLLTHNTQPISKLVELTNISSLVGNLLGGQISNCSGGLYTRNKPHTYPDLLPVPPHGKNIEIKIALDTNKPKGHLAKAGIYLTFRYVLGTKAGHFARGKEKHGDTVFLWEARIGELEEADFAISSTPGDSGKTAVIRTSVFESMAVVYFVPEFLPYSAERLSRYPLLAPPPAQVPISSRKAKG